MKGRGRVSDLPHTFTDGVVDWKSRVDHFMPVSSRRGTVTHMQSSAPKMQSSDGVVVYYVQMQESKWSRVYLGK